MLKNNIRELKEVSENIIEFYNDTDRFYEKKRVEV